MASPLAHSLFGFAVGAAYFLHRADGFGLKQNLQKIWKLRWMFVWCIMLANAPDMDVVFGFFNSTLKLYHRQTTHTLFWIVIISVVVWLGLRWALLEGGMVMWLGLRKLNRRTLKPLLLAFVLLFGHLIFDYFGYTVSKDLPEAYRYKVGLPLLYPFSECRFCSTVTLFPPMAKGLTHLFCWQNLRVILIELAWTLPLVFAVLWWKCRPPPALPASPAEVHLS